MSPAAAPLTRVELTWIAQKMEHWIRFGPIAEERIVTRRTRIVAFHPGAVFAFVRWLANDYGTVRSRIDVVRALSPGQPYTTLPFVRPGGEILLHVEGWPKVERVLQRIDAVEALALDPADIAPDYWRHVHHRLASGQEPRPYSLDQHDAWQRRAALQ